MSTPDAWSPTALAALDARIAEGKRMAAELDAVREAMTCTGNLDAPCLAPTGSHHPACLMSADTCVHCAGNERERHTNDDGNRECIDRVACLRDVMEATL